MNCRLRSLALLCLLITLARVGDPMFAADLNEASPADAPLTLTLRREVGESGQFRVVEAMAKWDAEQTAVIICDMWDDHWCQGAARRVVELAPAMNRVVQQMRSRGALIIHAPSTCTGFYEGQPARRRAQTAPHVVASVPLAESTRWGTCWCWPDPTRETDLPIDDSDMGCDCNTKCTIREAWTRQIATIEIDQDRDAITDNGQELVNLLAERQIKHVAIMGVHLNMCVLGRPFGIRQLTRLGQDVVLVRDMTDTMYDHRRRPFVSHFVGTDLVVQHVERYWCPTITSDQLVGGQPFRFSAADP